MNKIKNVFISAAITVCTLLSFSGCSGSTQTNNEKWDGYSWNENDNRKFFELSRAEQQEIPKKYLESLNEDINSYSIGNLEHKSFGNFSAMSDLNCNVFRPGKSYFTIWVSENGKVMDDRFMDDLEDDIHKYLSEKIQKVYPDTKIYTHTFHYSMPSKIWTKADGVEAMFNSEKDHLRTTVKVAFEKNKNISEDDLDNIINLLGLEPDVGSEVMLFSVDSLDDADLENMMYSDAVYRKSVSSN